MGLIISTFCKTIIAIIHPPAKGLFFTSDRALAKLPFYPVPAFDYITNVNDANDALRGITGGALTKSERKKKLADEVADKETFVIDWDNVKVRLVQIATNDGRTYLIDLLAMKALPEEFVRICNSRDIFKVSVGLVSDGQTLWDSFRLDLAGILQLSYFAKLADPLSFYRDLPYANEPGLDFIVANVLKHKLRKQFQRSDWGADTLTDEQKDYAAADAHAALQAYDILNTEVAKVVAQGYSVDPDWYLCDVFNRNRVRREDRKEWKADCPWWNAEKPGFTGRMK
ncbi:ribonuclease H-like domain-containing protein [Mycena haematopus]|nr:ribonuclease H-like domain-containing protein [Mycena haematopus]